MTDLPITFIHPIDSREIDVTVDDQLTGQAALDNLIAETFITANAEGYILAPKGGDQMALDQSFAAAGIAKGTKIKILPGLVAGA